MAHVQVVVRQLEAEVLKWKEFKFGTDIKCLGDIPMLVGGGFSALGNPSSYHGRTVREIRWSLETKLKLFWSHLWRATRPGEDGYEQQMMCRLTIRPRGASATAESWHRDLCQRPHGCESDMVLGGWLNLSSVDMNLSCIPKTHLFIRSDWKEVSQNEEEKKKKKMRKRKKQGGGFATLSKEEKKGYNALKKEIRVPNGHLLLFDESILHEVMSRKAKQVLVRLHTAWRLTSRPDHKFVTSEEDVNASFLEMKVPLIKSLQRPPMIPKAWLSFAKHMCKERMKTLSSLVVDQAKTPSGEIMMFMPSLLQMGLINDAITPPYTSEEKDIYTLRPLKDESCKQKKKRRRLQRLSEVEG